MLEEQFKNWFVENGIDIGVPFPIHLVDRLCRKALSSDYRLFCFLSKAFSYHKSNLLILKFKNWSQCFIYYKATTN